MKAAQSPSHRVTSLIILFAVIYLVGCDAFVRKFTRKPKKENLPQEEMILAPEEYKGAQMTKEELYRQYFMFWKSWQDELIVSLSEGRSQKKQLDCLDEAVKNLIILKSFLNEEINRKLDLSINALKDLRVRINNDLYGNNNADNMSSAERIKRDILRGFSYRKISKGLLQ